MCVTLLTGVILCILGGIIVSASLCVFILWRCGIFRGEHGIRQSSSLAKGFDNISAVGSDSSALGLFEGDDDRG